MDSTTSEPNNGSNRSHPDEDDEQLTALSLASFDYSDRNVRSRPISLPLQHPPHQLIRPLPRRIQTIQATILPLHPSQPQSPLRQPLNYPIPAPVPVPVPTSSTPPPPPPLPPPSAGAAGSSPSSSTRRSRRNSSRVSSKGRKRRNKIITPPFPWATEYKAKTHKIDYLIQNKILNITGRVQCKSCNRKYEMEFNLTKKFADVCMFVLQHKRGMRSRAPEEWCNPVLPTCRHCGEENSVKPIIEGKKRSINWLFLWLGQLLGLCTIYQLKYFCKQTGIHRTASKEHIVYDVYIGIGKQLAPGNFASL